MKCNHCGFENDENLSYCPRCGKQLIAETLSLNPMSDRVSQIFNSGLFLVVCILMSAAAVLALIGDGGLPVFQILFTIFLWLCFAQGKKGYIDHSHLRSLSGTVFAYYVVNYVLSGIIALCGVVVLAFAGIVKSSPEILEEIMNEFASDPDLAVLNELDIWSNFTGAIISIIPLIFLIIAVALILINIFGTRKIHKFIQSLYQSVEYNENRIVFAKAARTWLIVLGVLSVVGALFSLSSGGSAAIGDGCLGLCAIFAGVLINKHIIAE